MPDPGKKIIGVALLFYFLTIFQYSFLVHFFYCFPSLVLIMVVIINLVEEQKDNFGLASGLIGGFFLDIYSDKYIGYHVVILFLTAIFLKSVIKRILR